MQVKRAILNGCIEVVVKYCNPALLEDVEASESFWEGVRRLSACQGHPHIASLYGAVQIEVPSHSCTLSAPLAAHMSHHIKGGGVLPMGSNSADLYPT